MPNKVVDSVVMYLILISSAGYWTGARAADHFGPSSRVIVTALIRGATGGPAGLASEIGAAGSSVWEGHADQSALAPNRRRLARGAGLQQRVASAPALPSV